MVTCTEDGMFMWPLYSTCCNLFLSPFHNTPFGRHILVARLEKSVLLSLYVVEASILALAVLNLFRKYKNIFSLFFAFSRLRYGTVGHIYEVHMAFLSLSLNSLLQCEVTSLKAMHLCGDYTPLAAIYFCPRLTTHRLIFTLLAARLEGYVLLPWFPRELTLISQKDYWNGAWLCLIIAEAVLHRHVSECDP